VPAGPPQASPTAPAPANLAAPAFPADTLQVVATPHGVSVYAVSADAHALLTRLASESGMKLIVDDSVKRSITLNLIDKPAADVLANIVAAYGLSSREVNGIHIVSEGIPTSPSSYLLSDIDAIRTQYVLAPNAKSLLPVFLQDHVKTNAEQNSVILSAPPDVLKKFRQDISQFDIPSAQIMIDVLMVEFTDSGSREFNATLDLASRGHRYTADSALGEVFFQTLTTLPNGFNASIHSLVTEGKARVRANPSIATVSGQSASIFIGKQRYISTPVSIGSSGDYYGRQTNSIDAGVRLNMTPWTGGEGEIIVDIQPEISVLSAPDAKTGLPDKSTRRANTTMHVRDGETIIIGGLGQKETITTHTKIPLLGDLPLVGSAFRSRNDQTTTTDMVIFVTPHILSQTGHLPAEQEKAMRQKVLQDDGGQTVAK
jgi:type II secretory pathway component GspD/PulD (secretin)